MSWRSHPMVFAHLVAMAKESRPDRRGEGGAYVVADFRLGRMGTDRLIGCPIICHGAYLSGRRSRCRLDPDPLNGRPVARSLIRCY